MPPDPETFLLRDPPVVNPLPVHARDSPAPLGICLGPLLRPHSPVRLPAGGRELSRG